MDTDYEYKYKYIIIGDSGAGKSSLLLRFVDDRFNFDHDVTIGVEFGSKVFETMGTKVKAQIWDTAGQENYRSITRSYFRGTAVCLVVFDITRRDTYHHIDKWIEDYKEISPDSEIILVGNKSDLESRRMVSTEEAFIKAAEYGIDYVETSAKSDVSYAFTSPALSVTQRLQAGQILPLGHRGITYNRDRSVSIMSYMYPGEISSFSTYNCCST